MGGSGSGRKGGKRKVENAWSLDVNTLKGAGFLAPGHSGRWHWTEDGERQADIRLQMEGGGLRLDYRTRPGGGDWQSIDYRVPILWRPCTLGGVRPYFSCPGIRHGRHCGRAVVKLFCPGHYFLCRRCLNLAYASQSELPHDRALRRANKRRMRLGGEPGTEALLWRPKGMWRRRFERERARIFEDEAAADDHFLAWLKHRYPAQAVRHLLR